jgi:hypothetical protein
MVATQGHGVDRAYDRTSRPDWIVKRRWIWGEWHATVTCRDDRLSLVQWNVSGPMLQQNGDGEIFNRQLSVEMAKWLLGKLRTMMILEELSGA